MTQVESYRDEDKSLQRLEGDLEEVDEGPSTLRGRLRSKGRRESCLYRQEAQTGEYKGENYATYIPVQARVM